MSLKRSKKSKVKGEEKMENYDVKHTILTKSAEKNRREMLLRELRLTVGWKLEVIYENQEKEFFFGESKERLKLNLEKLYDKPEKIIKYRIEENY